MYISKSSNPYWIVHTSRFGGIAVMNDQQKRDAEAHGEVMNAIQLSQNPRRVGPGQRLTAIKYTYANDSTLLVTNAVYNRQIEAITGEELIDTLNERYDLGIDRKPPCVSGSLCFVHSISQRFQDETRDQGDFELTLFPIWGKIANGYRLQLQRPGEFFAFETIFEKGEFQSPDPHTGGARLAKKLADEWVHLGEGLARPLYQLMYRLRLDLTARNDSHTQINHLAGFEKPKPSDQGQSLSL